MKLTGWRSALITSLISQAILLFFTAGTLDGGRTYKILVAFSVVWSIGLIGGLLVQGFADHKILATGINLLVGILIPIMLFLAATRFHLYLKMRLGSLEFAPSVLEKGTQPEGLKGLSPIPEKGADR